MIRKKKAKREIMRRELPEEREEEGVVMKETVAVTGGMRGVWLLATSWTSKVCLPGLTFSKVYESVTALAAEEAVGVVWSSQR